MVALDILSSQIQKKHNLKQIQHILLSATYSSVDLDTNACETSLPYIGGGGFNPQAMIAYAITITTICEVRLWNVIWDCVQ